MFLFLTKYIYLCLYVKQGIFHFMFNVEMTTKESTTATPKTTAPTTTRKRKRTTATTTPGINI